MSKGEVADYDTFNKVEGRVYGIKVIMEEVVNSVLHVVKDGRRHCH